MVEIPPNIDLTENRDFRKRRNEFVMFDSERLELVTAADADDTTLMSVLEFERRRVWESIFGRNVRYHNEARIFNLDGELEELWGSHCARCGTRTYLWNRRYSLCPECDYELKTSTYGRMPWKWRDMNLSLPDGATEGEIESDGNVMDELFNNR